jgi:outer membrane immunogenic protein
MNRIGLFAGLAGAIISLASVAHAAPANTWTGPYIGANVGDDILSANRSSSANPTFWGVGFGPDTVSSLNSNASANFNKAGVVGGLQLGYNWQSGGMVMGLEADIISASANAAHDTGILAPPPLSPGLGTYRFAYTTEARDTVALLGRLGWVHGKTLVSLIGGIASADIRQSGHAEFDSGCGGPSAACDSDAGKSKTRTGWVLGVGVERKIDLHWSLKAEYLHMDFSSVSTNLPDLGCCAGSSFTQSEKVTEDIPSLGLNYRF